MSLTKREREVADLLGNALSNREIGARLCISPLTVDSHVKAIFIKTATHTRLGAVLALQREAAA